MGREVRRVPANWQHPKYPDDHDEVHRRPRLHRIPGGLTMTDEDGNYIPLPHPYDYDPRMWAGVRALGRTAVELSSLTLFIVGLMLVAMHFGAGQ